MQVAGHAYGLLLVNIEQDWRLWWAGEYADVLPEEQREEWVGL